MCGIALKNMPPYGGRSEYIMKKILSLSLALLMLMLSAFAVGCDSSNEGPAETSATPAVSSSAGDESSDIPVETTTFANTTAPDAATEAPAESTAPEVTTAPETTAAPEITTSPETTETPEVTTAPDTTSSTEITTSPETTKTPDVTTATPEETTSPAPHVHSYGSWQTEKQPTCTEPGLRVRRCACGETETEELDMIDHVINDDGICTVCGESFASESGGLNILDGFEIDNLYYSSTEMLVFKKGDLCYIADSAGNILTPGFTGIKCVDSDGCYVVAYNTTKTELEVTTDPMYGTWYTTRTDIKCYVLNMYGETVFTTDYSYTDSDEAGGRTFEGEYISSCNEGRIITTSPTEFLAWGLLYVPTTTRMYDMDGKLLATFDNVRSEGTMIGNRLVLMISGDYDPNGTLEAIVVDRDGNIVTSYRDPANNNLAFSLTFFGSNTWTTNGFIGGYAMLHDEPAINNSYITTLVETDFSDFYHIRSDYLVGAMHYGTLVATQIIENGVLSDKYYLVDLARCDLDENGYCIPSLKAAVSPEGFDSISLECIYGWYREYALVSRDGKWGYLALDGSSLHMYDDAGSFIDGLAIVIEDGLAYVIDQNLEKLTEGIGGYTAVSTLGRGIFQLRTESTRTVAVFFG